jgi:large subunit ribosomal protein L4
MPTVKVRNLKNKEIGEVQLSDAVFNAPFNEPLIHAAVRNFMANARQGTSATKTRGDVSGSGRKLWKQKGTGRARIASLRSPLWKGGGNAHGPQPRDWSYNMPKKMRRGALRSALSERVREGNVIVVEGWSLDKPKTKDFVASLATLGLQGKTLIVDTFDNENLLLSARNLQRAKVVNSSGLNIYDLLYHEKLVLSQVAIEELEQLLGPKEEKKSAAPDDTSDEKVEAAEATKTRKAAAAKPKRAGKPAGKPAAAKPKRASKAKKEAA